MKVAFLNNQIDNRGTGNALFDYAHYNEEILGNESYIMTLDTQPRNPIMAEKLYKRFGEIYNDPNAFPVPDVLYHIKYGTKEYNQYNFPFRYAVHAVFDASQPHGDRYAAISQWLGERNGVPWVPHIVHLENTTDDLRSSLNIPDTATVFGRHGAADTFDISFAWSAVNRALKEKENIYFLFLNTNHPDIDFYDLERVIFLEETVDPIYKRKFINTCDAMLHARQRGETFGIAVGEFAVAGKGVITYRDSPERAHIESLEWLGHYYTNEDELVKLLVVPYWKDNDIPMWSFYDECTPEQVMQKFKEVFLD